MIHLALYTIAFILILCHMKISSDIEHETEIKQKERYKSRSRLCMWASILCVIVGVYLSSKTTLKFGMNGSHDSEVAEIMGDERPIFDPEMYSDYARRTECNAYKKKLGRSIMERDVCYRSNPPQFIDEGPFSYDKTPGIGDLEEYINGFDCDTIIETAPRVINEAFECGRSTSVPMTPRGMLRRIPEGSVVSDRTLMSPTGSADSLNEYISEKNDILIAENRDLKRRLKDCIPVWKISEKTARRYEE